MPRLLLLRRKMPAKINGVARLKRAFNVRNARLRVAKRVLLVIVWAGSSTQESRRCKFFCVHYAIFALCVRRATAEKGCARLPDCAFSRVKRGADCVLCNPHVRAISPGALKPKICPN